MRESPFQVFLEPTLSIDHSFITSPYLNAFLALANFHVHFIWLSAPLLISLNKCNDKGIKVGCRYKKRLHIHITKMRIWHKLTEKTEIAKKRRDCWQTLSTSLTRCKLYWQVPVNLVPCYIGTYISEKYVSKYGFQTNIVTITTLKN